MSEKHTFWLKNVVFWPKNALNHLIAPSQNIYFLRILRCRTLMLIRKIQRCLHKFIIFLPRFLAPRAKVDKCTWTFADGYN